MAEPVAKQFATESTPMNNQTDKPKIIILCGPTAAGKTSAAIRVAQKVSAEIISADSLQVYRYMDIGTAKPTAEEQRQIPHHLIDVADPDEPYDAARYSREARRIINRLLENKVTPLVTGGTGLYLKALIYGLFEAAPSDACIRSRLKQEAEAFGGDAMYARLRRIDPQAAEKLHPKDILRILRAVEVYEASGKPISAFQQEHRFSDQPYQVLKIGLQMDRDRLYRRIDDRVDAMIRDGLLEEVKKLLAMGYDRTLKPMQSIGYRHMADFLDGRMGWEEAIRTLKRDTRRYAKRQMTWFKNEPDLIWRSPEVMEDIIRAVSLFLGS